MLINMYLVGANFTFFFTIHQQLVTFEQVWSWSVNIQLMSPWCILTTFCPVIQISLFTWILYFHWERYEIKSWKNTAHALKFISPDKKSQNAPLWHDLIHKSWKSISPDKFWSKGTMVTSWNHSKVQRIANYICWKKRNRKNWKIFY